MLNSADVKSVAVHPGIGIARVGNAKGADDYFFGPEVPGTGPGAGSGEFRNQEGALKRQAARFRVYATLNNGDIVEVTADDAEIEWRVQLANLKAGWYRFTTAMDLPRNLAVSSTRRNPSIGVDDVDSGFLARMKLDITPSPQKITGRSQTGPAFNDGSFTTADPPSAVPVYLGELRTDEKGRLIVLGGRGAAGSVPAGVSTTTFANNDGWHDDTSDGPVRATVRIGGRAFEADPGYVVVTPPNFGPGLFGVLTMDDVAREAFYAQGFLKPPSRPSFTRDIWPIFDRLTGNQWVNHGAFMLHGRGAPLDARDASVVARLADASAAAEPYRQAIFKLFRSPEAYVYAPSALPPFYGDGVDYAFGPYDATGDLSLTPTLYRLMKQWADSDFDSDWKGFPVPPDFDDIPPAQQPRALDSASLYDVLGGPFHPGIELTWIMRQPRIWRDAYRLNIDAEGTRTRQDYGPELTPEVCLGEDGPLSATGAGALTRWMGVPWQTDGGSCASGGDYTPTYYLSVPSFWASRVPNDVLPEAAYERMKDTGVSNVQRTKHFDSRSYWYRLLRPYAGYQRAVAMITQWPNLGVVEPVPGPQGYDGVFHVEISPLDPPGVDPTFALVAAVEDLPDAAAPPTALRKASPATKTFKPPRIHYRRGDV